MAQRMQWEDLPASLKEAIEKRTGPITAGRAVADGQNSPLAAVVETGSGRVFVKGMPSGHRMTRAQAREAAAAPLVTLISPALLWHFDEAGWNVLGFEHIEGRAADYGPGSPDLESVLRLLGTLGEIEVPAGHGPVKYAEDRWKGYVDNPADALVLAGTSLIHTDWMPDNVLITPHPHRAWLVDWAWATAGAAWIDPACLLLRMAAWGHPIADAEAWAARLPAYAAADPAHVDVFARANVTMWDEITRESSGIAWAMTMADTARAWAEYRMSTRAGC